MTCFVSHTTFNCANAYELSEVALPFGYRGLSSMILDRSGRTRLRASDGKPMSIRVRCCA